MTPTGDSLLADQYNISTARKLNLFQLQDITWPDLHNYLINTPKSISSGGKQISLVISLSSFHTIPPIVVENHLADGIK